jgi:hypothetical protein
MWASSWLAKEHKQPTPLSGDTHTPNERYLCLKALIEFPRIPIPRRWVNKGKKEGRGCSLLLGGATYNNAGTWERLGEEAECESWGNFY